MGIHLLLEIIIATGVVTLNYYAYIAIKEIRNLPHQ
jgi:hypothetical protein